MKEIIVATGNEEKMKEIRQILAGDGVEYISLKDAGFDGVEIVEDGKTFEENALIKARTISKLAGRMAIADDSGLEVDYLDGAPGIYSARFLGEDTPYSVKNKYILDRLDGVEDEKRGARFVCAVACVFPDGDFMTRTGIVKGRIGYEEKGENGFGYDPIFYLPDRGCTTAELLPEEKNKISHRGKALAAMHEELARRGIV